MAATTGGASTASRRNACPGAGASFSRLQRRAGDLEQRVARRLAAGDPIGGGDGQAITAAHELAERRLDGGEERMALGDVEVHRQGLGGIALGREVADHHLALADQP